MQERIGILVISVLLYIGWVVLLRKHHPNRATRRNLAVAGVLLLIPFTVFTYVGYTYMWFILLRKEKVR